MSPDQPVLHGVDAAPPAAPDAGAVTRLVDVCNIASALPQRAAVAPDQVALRCPGSRGPGGLARYDVALTYAELDRRSDAIAAGLAYCGLLRGMRAVVMVRPGPEFFLVMFALLKAGVVPVLVDPGIDKRALKQCLDEAEPDAFIGIPLAQTARVLLRWARSAQLHVTVGARLPWGGPTLAQVELAGTGAGPQLAATQPEEVAAILFTSGSTGVPKGVVYRHRHFVAQVGMLRDAFGLQAGGVDLATFPPFALFDPALGLTSVIPDMDPTRPGKADPRRLVDAIQRFGTNQLFGSPALIKNLAAHGVPLPTLARVTSAGAPVPPETVAAMRALLPPDAQLWTPYGATESLPVAVIESRELATTRAFTERGFGTCIGRPVTGNTVRLIAITDAPIDEWTQAVEVEDGAVGEITVAGPATTDAYFNRPEATRLGKIPELDAAGDTRIVHRMGDLAWRDREGRLWFCGRKAHRVETVAGPLYTEQVEPIFNLHPEVRRTALVGVGPRGAQTPVLCVELREGVDAVRQWQRIEEELFNLGGRHARSAPVQAFLRHPRFPVDIRHNAKIGRETLAAWAAKRVRTR